MQVVFIKVEKDDNPMGDLNNVEVVTAKSRPLNFREGSFMLYISYFPCKGSFIPAFNLSSNQRTGVNVSNFSGLKSTT